MINFRKLFTSMILPYSLLILIVSLFIPQISCSFFESKEDYKKEIELKGIEYSRVSFLNELKNGNKEIVELFIKAGFDINYKDKDGLTPLMLMLSKNNIEAAILLVENGADVNVKMEAPGLNNGLTALHVAAGMGNYKLTKLLIKNGADVNAKMGDGRTALFEVKSIEIAKLLIENGIDVNVKNNEGSTALFRVRDIETAKLLIDNGADINTKDNYGYNVFITQAYIRFNVEIVKLLIEKGVDINAKNNDGKTALMLVQEDNPHATDRLKNGNNKEREFFRDRQKRFNDISELLQKAKAEK